MLTDCYLNEQYVYVDAHPDLAMNALEWNHYLRKPASEINKRQENLTDKPDREKEVVSLSVL